MTDEEKEVVVGEEAKEEEEITDLTNRWADESRVVANSRQRLAVCVLFVGRYRMELGRDI